MPEDEIWVNLDFLGQGIIPYDCIGQGEKEGTKNPGLYDPGLI